MSSVTRLLSGLRRYRLVPILAGLAIGAFWGWSAASTTAVPSAHSMDRSLQALAAALVLGPLGLLALILLAVRRPAGIALALTVLCAAIGWRIAFDLGPKYTPPADLAGTISVDLTAPLVLHLSGEATCDTEFSGDRGIRSVTGMGIGTLDGASLGAFIGFSGSATMGITIDHGPVEEDAYFARLTNWDPAADRLSGSVAFVAEPRAGAFGGAGRAATGTVTWECRR